nr:CpsD/CapB family tyrosine-protein kinase [uncultured Mediterraneibacter sp.]
MIMQDVFMINSRKPDYFYEEAIKTLRTNIQFSGADIKTIVVTSCFPNEGKSDVTFQLAFEIGKIGKKVLLLDADIRKSEYVNRYQVRERINGLSQYLSGQKKEADIIYRTNYENLDIIFAGPVAPNPAELLEQDSFGVLLRSLREKYDYVLIDTPPIGSLTDAAIVSKQCDGAMLVIESETVSRHMALKAKEHLEKSGCRMLGAVLNKVDFKKDKYYSKHSYYYKNDK